MRRAHFKTSWIVAALLAPQLLVIFIFFYWPSAQALYWAFTLEQPWGGGNTWVGFDNFRAVLSDPYYWGSVRVSVIFALATTALAMGMALTLALFVDRQLTGYKAFRVGLIWPYAVAAPAVGLAFQFVFNPGAGIFSYINTLSPGLWDPSRYPAQAVLTIIIAGAWKQVAYSFIFFLAALQSIPRSVLEAASIDGASPVHRFHTVIFPLLSPTTFFLLVINITYAFFDTFGIIDALTKGGPGNATQTLIYRAYIDGRVNLDLGSSSAQSVVLMIAVMALTLVQFRFIERKVHY